MSQNMLLIKPMNTIHITCRTPVLVTIKKLRQSKRNTRCAWVMHKRYRTCYMT